ncbi:MAG: hypothetical protein WAW88_07190 [Nocardioides sp.]
MGFFVAVLIRVIAVGLAGQAVGWVLTRGDEYAGANIGAGLLAMAAMGLLSFGWSLVDGRSLGTSPAVLLWAAVALGIGVGSVLLIWGREGLDVQALLTDLARLVPFMGILIFAPAAVGAAIGGSRRRTT